jgi:hypothetical protein
MNKDDWRANRFFVILMAVLIALPVQSVTADDGIVENPGVVGQQEEIRAQSVQWVLPYGTQLFVTVDEEDVIYLDWESVDIYSTSAPVEGVLALNTLCGAGGVLQSCMADNTNIVDPSQMTPAELGLPLVDVGAPGYQNDCDMSGNNCEKIDGGVKNGGTFTPTNSPTVVVIKAGPGQFFFVENMAPCNPATMAYCVTWNEDESITVVRNGSGPSRKEISNIQFWHTNYSPEPMPEPDNLCPNVNVAPGAISVSSSQIAPGFAVVSGQDPNRNGVTLEWFFSLDPTIVTYERWEVLNREWVACVEGAADNEANNPCSPGWHAIYRENWGCAPHEIVYREEVSDLSALASLSLDSRVWITDELNAAYPGAHLIQPDWGLDAPEACGWVGNTCVISFTARFEMVDPGTYDVKMMGETSGTEATPPRSFDEVAGAVDVHLIDSSAIGPWIPVTP